MDYFLPVSPDTLAQHLGPPTRANDDAPRPSGREIRVLMHPGILMPTQAAAATHGSALPVVVSIGALVVAILAVFINLSALPRWPKVRVRSGEVQDAPPVEGTVIVVTARRRPRRGHRCRPRLAQAHLASTRNSLGPCRPSGAVVGGGPSSSPGTARRREFN